MVKIPKPHFYMRNDKWICKGSFWIAEGDTVKKAWRHYCHGPNKLI